MFSAQFLSSLPRQMKIFCSLSSAERELSDVLGGISIPRRSSHNLTPAVVYLSLLQKLSNRIGRYRQTTEGQRELGRIGRGALANVELNIIRLV